jgi:putative flippase GtrA
MKKLFSARIQYLANFEYSIVRWAIIGLLTNLVDFLLFIYLYKTFNSVFIANLISASISTLINYFFHHSWTFKTNQNHSISGTKYLLNLTFWWLVSTSIIKVLVELEIDPKVAKLVPLVLIVPINYFVLNFIIFKRKN